MQSLRRSWAKSFGQAVRSYNGGHVTAGMVQGYYEQHWQGTGRYNIRTNDAHGVREGQGFSVGYNFKEFEHAIDYSLNIRG